MQITSIKFICLGSGSVRTDRICYAFSRNKYPLRSGVDINTIRAWLGHVSINTTNIYAKTDLEMKAKALANCEVKETKRIKRWGKDKGLMTFLRTL